MGKTIQPAGFSTLAALRQNAAAPAYTDRPPLRRLDLRNGYFVPDALIDSKETSAGVLPSYLALSLPTFSSIYSNPISADLAAKEVLAQALQGALPAFEDDNDLPANWPLRFRSEGVAGEPLIPMAPSDVFSDEFHFNPELPLIVTRPESASREVSDLWSASAYAYDPYCEQWFLLTRQGRASTTAYIRPYKAQHTAKKAGLTYAKQLYGRALSQRNGIMARPLAGAKTLDLKMLLRPRLNTSG